jgi:hypothetical protein
MNRTDRFTTVAAAFSARGVVELGVVIVVVIVKRVSVRMKSYAAKTVRRFVPKKDGKHVEL